MDATGDKTARAAQRRCGLQRSSVATAASESPRPPLIESLLEPSSSRPRTIVLGSVLIQAGQLVPRHQSAPRLRNLGLSDGAERLMEKWPVATGHQFVSPVGKTKPELEFAGYGPPRGHPNTIEEV